MQTRYIVAALCLVVFDAPRAALGQVLRTVALTGQQAPGAPDDVVYSGFRFGAVLNEAGQTAFEAFLAGPGAGTANDVGVWSEGSGSLALVAREGSPAPGGGNFLASLTVADPILNEAGKIAFDHIGRIFSDRSGSLAEVARSGMQAAGMLGGFNYSVPFLSAFNNAGQTAFQSGISVNGLATNIRGIWSEGSGSVALVAQTGVQAPGRPDGVTFSNVAFPLLNDAGQTVFYATFSGDGVDINNNEGLWSDRSGSVAAVALEGNQAPGTPVGVVFAEQPDTSTSFRVGTYNLNIAGDVAFRAGLSGNGVDDSNDEGIWSDGSGSLAIVAREGSQVPGLPSGVAFAGLGNPELNDADQTAFWASVSGNGVDSTNDSGIWLGDSGELSVIVREGSPAPGTPSGVNFGAIQPTFAPKLNAVGQIAFLAELAGDGVDMTNNEALWATTASGDLQLIARTGELLEVAPGDFRTISDLIFRAITPAGNGNGRESPFNNLGQLAFRALFTDVSAGLFVSNAVAVPQPSGVGLLACGLIIVWTSDRHRRSRR